MPDRPHGYARYRLDGCRCYECSYAVAEYNDRRSRLIAYGRWQPYVDPAEAQFHILSLKDLGYGDRQIARLACVNRKQIRDIAAGIRHDPSRGNPPITKIRKETAAAILAVKYDPMSASDGTYIDATLTWQRVAELLEAGHTKAWISAQIGQGGQALQLGAHRVTARNARAVQELHARVFGPRAAAAPALARPRGLVRTAAEILADISEVGEDRVLVGAINTTEEDNLP